MTTDELFTMLACDGFYFAHDDVCEDDAFRRCGRAADDGDRTEYEELLDLGNILSAR